MPCLLFFVFCVAIPNLIFAAIHAPNVDQIRYSINLFLGQTPFEQRTASVGDQLFKFTEPDSSDEINGPYIPYDQLEEISAVAECNYQEKAHTVSWSTSFSTLERQATASSNGFDQRSTIGISSKGFKGETNLRNVLSFGNSKTSEKQYENLVDNYWYTFDASSGRSVYSAEVDWDNFGDNDWTDDFKAALNNLGNNPSINDILNFFRHFGTHGLLTASFGQTCTASVFMKGGYSKSYYSQFNSDSSSSTVGLYWWTSSSQTTQDDSETSVYENSFEYYFGNRYCRGELDFDSSCGGGMKSSGIDSPAIIGWTYKPIWEMNVPGFDSNAKAIMKQVAEDIYIAGNECRIDHCNNNGNCRSDISMWSSDITITSTDEFYRFWDSSVCFCDETFRGEMCDEGALLAIESDVEWIYWSNAYDGTLDYTSLYGEGICGIKGQHSNYYEDRKFGFKPCKTESINYRAFVGNRQSIGTTWYDETWKIECDSDKILRKLYSWHNNHYEDRRWQFECQKLDNTIITDCKWDIIWRNNYDGFFEETCDNGYLLHGLQSQHNNHYDDRRFKFKCCQLSIDNNNYVSIVKNAAWSSYVNNWDSGHTTEVYASKKVICGVSSYHDNGKEDRRFRFKYCNTNDGISLTGTTSWSVYNNWDSHFTYECSNSKSFITAWSSYHNNGKEDRKFKFRCSRYNSPNTIAGDCTWTPWVNWMDQQYHFECGDNYGIAGVTSYHSNHFEDRRFKFKCCKIAILK